MKYKITITKVETVTKKETSWEKLYGDEVYKDLMNPIRPDYDPERKQYDYVSTEQEKDVEVEIYRQTVEGELDLKAVIDAVNK